jgi:tricorn protease
VPAEKGDIRNLTRTPSVVERDPAWSPDGKSIAYLSDELGEYAMHIRDQNGLGDVRKIQLSDSPTFYYSPRWSPDSRKLVYSDKRLNLWYVDLDKKRPVRGLRQGRRAPLFCSARSAASRPEGAKCSNGTRILLAS